jgi:hypothetical protein
MALGTKIFVTALVASSALTVAASQSYDYIVIGAGV